jgi:hypothetical protein
VLFYKIVNGQVPDYLTELVPPTVDASSICNSMIMLFLNKLNLLQNNRKCSEHSFLYPHEQEALGTNFDLNKSLMCTKIHKRYTAFRLN